MPDQPEQPRTSDRLRDPGVTELQATRLLSLGLSNDRRPIDDLIDRLDEPDGARWLERVLTARSADVNAALTPALSSPQTNLALLKAVKERGKTLVKETASGESRLEGLAIYFLALAAALVHHQRLISRQRMAEVRDVMLDLAAVAPTPWSDLLTRAAAIEPIG